MTAPIISHIFNGVFSYKYSFSEEIKAKSVGYWHTHGAAKENYSGEEMSNPEDFDQFLQWSLLSTPSNQWLRAENLGLKSNGKPYFKYERYDKDNPQWIKIW